METGKNMISLVPIDRDDIDDGRKFDKKELINILNFINFQDEKIGIILKHKKYETIVSILATPLPSDGIHLDCIWTAPIQINLENYEFHEVQVHHRRSILSIKSNSLQLSERGICICLPETCPEIRNRKSSRYHTSGISARVIQNSICFVGQLIDFSPTSLRVEVEPPVSGDFQWISPADPVTILLEKSGELLFSTTCTIVRQSQGRLRRSIVLTPLPQATHRFQPKKFRSHRLQLHPSPSVQFKHPITGKLVQRKIFDISGSGISLDETEEDSVLLPGLIIPRMGIGFASGWQVECRGQVVYKHPADSPSTVRCGIAFLDMPTRDHISLQSLLHQAEDRNTYVGNQIDTDDLFEFFFRTGFIYANKYTHMAQEKARIKQIYSLLYTKNPEISRHFIYQEKGEILGHMAMVRFYSRSWLIHHHAANRIASRQAGLAVLAQIGRSIRESQRLPSAKMSFVLAYFRPDNKFPRRVFGGVAQHFKDPKGCSLDKFAFFYPPETVAHDLPSDWSFSESTSGDLMELESFYERESGGLLIPALDLEPSCAECRDVTEEYKKLGLRRERYLYTLKNDGVCKAIVIINNADFGLNLSDLTNSLKIFILDPDLPKPYFLSTLHICKQFFDSPVFPILVNNRRYLELNNVDVEKNYNLWILNCQNLDPYFEFCQKLFNRT